MIGRVWEKFSGVPKHYLVQTWYSCANRVLEVATCPELVRQGWPSSQCVRYS